MGEDEKRDNQEIEAQKKEMQDTHKKANKSKFKMLATIIAFIVSHFLAIIVSIGIITILILFLDYILDEDGDNKIADIASETVIKEDMSIDCVPGTDKYYFKIDQEVYKKYLKYLNKAYYEGYYHYDNPDLDKKEFVYDTENADINENDLEEWFKTRDNKKYIVKMIRAQIASSYPKLSDYEGKININVDPLNPIDDNGDYVTQGVAEIWRTKINNDGSTGEEIRLTYLPYDKFHQLVEEQKPEALGHFSFDENSGLLYYAIYRQETVTINGVDYPEMGSFTLIEESKSYKTITKLCDMPFNFLFSLLQESENPNYLMAVIDLLMEEKNTKLKLMIQDELAITTITKVDTEYHAQKTVTTTYTTDNTSGNLVTYSRSSTSYSYPAGNSVVTTQIEKTYENTANVFIKEAYTWCIDYEQEAVQPAKYNAIYGEVISDNYTYTQSELAALSYRTVGYSSEPQSQNQASYTTIDTGLSLETLPYEKTRKQDYESYTYDIVPVTEKRINYEKFLGLWKNDKGEYYLGCEYDFNGKEVKFNLPKDNEKEYNFPAVEIPEYDEMRIDSLIDLLSNHADTEMQEKLMKYYWNIYMNEDIYEVDVDEILSLFNTNLSTISYGTILINGCNLDREEFISSVENYSTSSAYQDRFAQYAGLIYDICVSKNINPILCVAVAGQESNFGANVPSNSKYNYWGIGVYNNSSTGTTFNSMEDAIEYWCDLITTYQAPGTSQNNFIIERSTAFKAVNSKFTGSATNVYDLWSIYAWLGDDHQSIVYGDVNVKDFIDRFLTNIECNHNLSDATTVEEQAAYIEYYVDNGINRIAKEVFGNKAIGGNASTVVDYALQFVGQNHTTFTSYYHTNADWCAMFVSYCFDKCGLIPDVLPSSYKGCSAEVKNLRNAGLFRERSSGYMPKAGDIVFFKSVGSSYISTHTGIVTDCDGIKVYTVEGNTNGSDESHRPAGVSYWQTSKVATHSYNLTSAYIVRLYGNIDLYGGKRFEKIKNYDNCNYNNNDYFNCNNLIINKEQYL